VPVDPLLALVLGIELFLVDLILDSGYLLLVFIHGISPLILPSGSATRQRARRELLAMIFPSFGRAVNARVQQSGLSSPSPLAWIACTSACRSSFAALPFCPAFFC